MCVCFRPQGSIRAWLHASDGSLALIYFIFRAILGVGQTWWLYYFVNEIPKAQESYIIYTHQGKPHALDDVHIQNLDSAVLSSSWRVLEKKKLNPPKRKYEYR